MSMKEAIVQRSLEELIWPEVDRTLSAREIDALRDMFQRVQQRQDANLAAAVQAVRLGLSGNNSYFVAATSGGAVTTQLRVQDGIVVAVGATLPDDYTSTPFEAPTNNSGRTPKNIP